MDDETRRRIRAEFPEGSWAAVEEALARYGSRPHDNEVERVRNDVLELAKGDPRAVEHYVEQALIDYRDILYYAEYYDTDPWAMWMNLLRRLEEAGHLSSAQVESLDPDAGFRNDRSIAAIARLCDLLVGAGARISRAELEAIRAFGKRVGSRACWTPLRKQVR